MPPGQVLWNDRPLYELRVRLASERARQQRQNPNMLDPGVPRWRATYGGVAPLASTPLHYGPTKDGSLGVYSPEVARLNLLAEQGRASANDLFMLGLIYYDLGRNPQALAAFDQAVRLAGRPADEWIAMRGLARYAMGQQPAALADLDEAVRLSPNVRNLNNRGVVLIALGRSRQAIRDFDAALSERQFIVKTAAIFINRARAYSDLGQHDRAVKDLNALVERGGDPDAAIPANELCGMIYRRMGDFRRSGMCYDTVIQLKRVDNVMVRGLPTGTEIENMPTNHTLMDEIAGEETGAEALLGRGIAHQELGQIKAAIDDYSKAMRLAPKMAAAYVDRAAAYAENGDLDLAEMDLRKALELDPNDAYAYGNRGRLRLLQNRAADAQADLDRCLTIRPDLRPIVQQISAQPRLPLPGQSVIPAIPGPTAQPAQRPYTATTPEAAIAWLEAARKAENWDDTLRVLADPVGPLLARLWDATRQMDAAQKRFQQVKNAHSARFFDPSHGPLEQQIAREKRRAEERQKFLVQQMTVLERQPMNQQGTLIRLTVRIIKANALGERQTPKEVFIAVQERGVWKLMPEGIWQVLESDEGELFIQDYVRQQTARLDKMRAITEAAIQDLKAGKQVSELEVLAAWAKVSEGVPWPGRSGDEPPTLTESLLEYYSAYTWGPSMYRMYQARRGMQMMQPQGNRPVSPFGPGQR